MNKKENGMIIPMENEKIEVIRIENTPFDIVKGDENCFITLGKYRISPIFKDVMEAKKWSTKNNLKLISDVTSILLEAFNGNNLKIKKDE